MPMLTRPQVRVLQALEGGPSLDRYQLGSAAGVSAPELEEALGSLMTEGYIDSDDRAGIERFRVVDTSLKRLLTPFGE